MNNIVLLVHMNTLMKTGDSGLIITNKKADLDTLLSAWIESIDVKPSTRIAYTGFIRAFFKWTIDTSRGLNLTAPDILAYKQYLLTNKSNLTTTAYLTAVRMFYTWTEGQGLYPNIARGIKSANRSGKYQRQYLNPKQVGDLLDKYQPGTRDYALVNLAVRTGLRTIEIVRARIEDLTVRNGRRVLMIQGKGKDHRQDFVLLSNKASEPIHEYLNRERTGAGLGEPLFTSASRYISGDSLSTRSIRTIVGKGLRAIGLDTREYSAHSLRHTTAVNLIQAGADIIDVQGVMRHTTPATTQIYLKTIAEDQRLEKATEHILDNVY